MFFFYFARISKWARNYFKVEAASAVENDEESSSEVSPVEEVDDGNTEENAKKRVGFRDRKVS